MNDKPLHHQHLDIDGYAVITDLIGDPLIDRVRKRIEAIYDSEGENAGSEFKQEDGCRRLANLMNKGDVFTAVVAHAKILPFVEHVLGPFKLSSLNAREVSARSTTHQPLHCDMAAIPDGNGFWVCNVLWMMDDFTRNNGALRVVPKSHRFKKLPSEVLDDPFAPHPDEVLVTGKAGTVVIINAHLWHAGTANKTDGTRAAVHAFYCRRDKPQQQYQKQLVDQSIQDSFTPDIRKLLALDCRENDLLSQEVHVRSGFMK